MLKLCHECKLQVSDKAIACPHCGYPLKPEAKKYQRKNSRHRKLPNGFGQISEIKNQNLRNPFRVMVPCGKNENGRPISKPLKPKAYFPSYNEAYAALIEYNRNPYSLDEMITVKELFDRWSKEHSKKVSSESSRNIDIAFGYCSEIYNLHVRDLKTHHVKNCLENGTRLYQGEYRKPTYNTKKLIKTTISQMLDYAVEYELIEKNCAKIIKIDKDSGREIKPSHIPYTEEEINKLWDNLYKIDMADMILIQCYSGWRPKELTALLIENINLEEKWFIGGSKTEAGKNRKVPIHSKIYPLVEKRYNEAIKLNSKYLFNEKGKHVGYGAYYYNLNQIISKLELNPDHKPHDARKHFVTTCKKYGVDEYAIKHMVGHSITDITEAVYTQRDIEWLREEIEKIKGNV